ncbi:hypothetical protein WJR50_19240 [Catalinimonas sp. 4WD22]|uniref:hypothetical protein n=1 Tax=Catalinimonas locisalis TaxID=3133978 RepID=UPI003100E47C
MSTIEKESMVKRMRAIREELNEQFEHMSFQQEKSYIKKELTMLKKKREAARKKS